MLGAQGFMEVIKALLPVLFSMMVKEVQMLLLFEAMAKDQRTQIQSLYCMSLCAHPKSNEIKRKPNLF